MRYLRGGLRFIDAEMYLAYNVDISSLLAKSIFQGDILMGKKMLGLTAIAVLVVISLVLVLFGAPALSLGGDEHLTLVSDGNGDIYVYSNSQNKVYTRTSGIGIEEFEVTLDGVTETCGALWCDFSIPADGKFHHVSIKGRETVGMFTSSEGAFLLVEKIP